MRAVFGALTAIDPINGDATFKWPALTFFKAPRWDCTLGRKEVLARATGLHDWEDVAIILLNIKLNLSMTMS
jgi:hypothetical protein